MGKVVEKRKKGRPSLLDLQKRTIKQQLQHHQPNPNPNPNHNSTSHRRSTRRNPNPGDNTDATGEDDDDGGLNGKLKVVLKFPSPLNSASLNSGSYGGDSNIEVDDYGTNHKKQKLNGIGDGSGDRDTEEAEKHVSTTNSANTPQGTQLDMGPSTPLPDKKLLLFILDRLQKKDTYGVFAEPVDPEELPDYHEVVEHPMDFGTARKNLGGGAYASLEQFEKDVFLICSNAMQYNSPETIYYRQARYIQEMAKKYFKDLRQESDDNEPERKIVRRGRPPTKNLKKQIGRPPLEHVSSQFSSDALLGTGSDNTIKLNFDPTKGPVSDKPGRSDFSVRSQNSETYSHWLAEQKSERNAKITGSQLSWAKRGKKQFVFDESRRNTYTQSHISSGVQEPSVLTTFDGQRKQLMAVGLHTEYGYARSLARFGANLGPDAWKVVSKKIEKSLPVGVKFGPGWVGDIEEVQLKSLPILSTSSVQPPPSSSSLSKPISRPENSFAAATPSTLEIRTEKLSEISEGNKLVASTHSTVNSEQPNKPRTVSSAPTSTPIIVTESANPLRGMNSHTNTSTMNRSVNMIRPRPQPLIEIHHPSMNGLTSPRMGLQTHPHWQQVSVQMKKDAVPPDLNIRFQSPGSPTLSRAADSMQPDLVLQL